MRRSESCWSVAEVAAGIAYRCFTGTPDDPATAEKKAQTEIYGLLCRAFAGPPERMVDDLVCEARSHEQNVRDSGYDPSEAEDDPDFRPPAEVLEKAMSGALRELRELVGHSCTFSEDETTGHVSCPVCGSSGLI